MGRYSSRQRDKVSRQRNTVNPYMRGIGCFFIVLVPVFSLAVGDVLAKQGVGWQILPASWYVRMTFPEWFTQLAGLSTIARWLGSIDNLPATLAIGTIVMIVVGGILSIIFGYMYTLLSPSKYGTMDVPAPRVKTKKYKR
jgi:hypothetical protein